MAIFWRVRWETSDLTIKQTTQMKRFGNPSFMVNKTYELVNYNYKFINE